MNCKVCQNLSGKSPALSFFRFPSDYNRCLCCYMYPSTCLGSAADKLTDSYHCRCREWAERCDIVQMFDRYGPVKFYKSFRICSEHFDSKYIVFDGRKKKLLNCAVPRLVKPKKEIKHLAPQKVDTGLRVTQKLLENLCRFCAEENTELTDIFSHKGISLELEEKIKVFPITVSKLDKLPLKVCNSCIVKISKFHEFVRNCVKADLRLKTILGTAEFPRDSSAMSEVPVDVQDKDGIFVDLKSSRNLTDGSGEANKSDILNSKMVFLPRDGILAQELSSELECHLPRDGNVKCSSQLDNFQAADASFSYISAQEDLLLTKSNDVFGKKISVSSIGNKILDRYICNVCSKTFSASDILESHWKAHSLQPDENGRFLCQTCNKVFPNKYRLNEHNRVHTGEYPFKCTVCDKKFHKMALLKQHSIVHESNKPFICSLCNLRSSRKGNLLQHLKTHSHKDFKKENCKFFSISNPDGTNSNSFAIGNNLPNGITQHSTMENNQSDPDGTNYAMKIICGTCQTHFPDLETFEQHFKSHPVKLEQNCNQSRNEVSSGREICAKRKLNMRHKKSVHQKTYQCEECGVRFKRKDTLANHVRIHTGERPFVCGSCGFAFKQKGDCRKHERNHQKTNEEGTENYS